MDVDYSKLKFVFKPKEGEDREQVQIECLV